MARPLTIELNAEQRRELEQARDHHALPHVREKAAAILKIANGQSGRDVAFHGLLRHRRTETVYRWVHRYLAAGVAGLLVRNGRGRKPAFPPQQVDAASAQTALLHVLRRDPHQLGYDQSSSSASQSNSFTSHMARRSFCVTRVYYTIKQ